MEDLVFIRGSRSGELLMVPAEDLKSPAKMRWWLNENISTLDPVVKNSIDSKVWLRYKELTKPVGYKELTKPVERSWAATKLLTFRRYVNRLYWQDRVPYIALKLVWRVTPNVGF